jgi:hypothetical protein
MRKSFVIPNPGPKRLGVGLLRGLVVGLLPFDLALEIDARSARHREIGHADHHHLGQSSSA